MDAVLCDELLQEIFRRLPPSSSATVSAVSRRWLYLHRASTTSLSLHLPAEPPAAAASAFLSRYPFLSSLTVTASSSSTASDAGPAASDLLLALCCSCPSTLRDLRFLYGPVSASALLALSPACAARLTSLAIALARPLSFLWLATFHSLKTLSLYLETGAESREFDSSADRFVSCFEEFDADLPLETLCLSGIRADDQTLGWLWRSCRRLRRLRLRNCEGIGDGGSYASFIHCLQNLQELELRTCRRISNGILSRLAENCFSLDSLLIYDGGSKDGLLRFINQCRCNLLRLDLRLPLDLDNVHLTAVARNFRGLLSLRLQSCCLVTGEGLRSIGQSMARHGLDELALINCDVIEREPGLLATLGQNLRHLRKLDLSHNETLLDIDLMSMLVSCEQLIDLKLRGCRLLTEAAMVHMLKYSWRLECIDIVQCFGIEAAAVEAFVLSSRHLRRLEVEEIKLSDAVRMWASRKLVELVFD